MSSDSLRVRKAGPSDLTGLLALYRDLTPGDPPLSYEAASAILDRFARYEGSAILVGEVAGELVASCTLVVVPNLTRGGSPYGLIENVVTRRDVRQRGYGRSLLDAASQAAWAAGCYKVMLLAGSTDPDIMNFYHGAGFEQSKTGFQKRRIPQRG